jgi:hypothetical protein
MPLYIDECLFQSKLPSQLISTDAELNQELFCSLNFDLLLEQLSIFSPTDWGLFKDTVSNGDTLL